MPSYAADATPVGFAARSTDLAIWTGFGRLSGWSIRETAGAVAAIRFHDGTDATGEIIGVVGFAANASDQGPNMDEGIRFSTGVFMERVSGTFEGVVYIRSD